MAIITNRLTRSPVRLVNEFEQPLHRRIRTLMARIEKWHRNHSTRRQLANLPDQILKDIGIKRHEALREAHKPFWKD